MQDYILKESPIKKLLDAIRIITIGGTYFGERNTNFDVINTVATPADETHELLNSREIKILKLVAEELSSSQIAARLCVSVSSVDSPHKNNINKSDENNIVVLIKFAVSGKLI